MPDTAKGFTLSHLMIHSPTLVGRHRYALFLVKKLRLSEVKKLGQIDNQWWSQNLNMERRSYC